VVEEADAARSRAEPGIEVRPPGRRLDRLGGDAFALEEAAKEGGRLGLVARRIGRVDADVVAEDGSGFLGNGVPVDGCRRGASRAVECPESTP
jgi:hypothetical protein